MIVMGVIIRTITALFVIVKSVSVLAGTGVRSGCIYTQLGAAVCMIALTFIKI